MRQRINPSLTSVCIVLFLAGCSTAPLSVVDGNPRTTVDPLLYPVRIVSVDASLQFHNPVYLAPGPRWLVIEAAPGRGVSIPTLAQQSFVFKVEPCTRYFLAAKRESQMAAEWKLVVDTTEKVSGCNPEEELKKSEAEGTATPKPPASSPK